VSSHDVRVQERRRCLFRYGVSATVMTSCADEPPRWSHVVLDDVISAYRHPPQNRPFLLPLLRRRSEQEDNYKANQLSELAEMMACQWEQISSSTWSMLTEICEDFVHSLADRRQADGPRTIDVATCKILSNKILTPSTCRDMLKLFSVLRNYALARYDTHLLFHTNLCCITSQRFRHV